VQESFDLAQFKNIYSNIEGMSLADGSVVDRIIGVLSFDLLQ
jgi:hypothetical protein